MGSVPLEFSVASLRGTDHLSEPTRGRVGPCACARGGGCHLTTSESIAEFFGDYRAFAEMQRDRLDARGFDVAHYALSHLAYRVADWDVYVHLRTLLERHAAADLENFWNGRPISSIIPAEPLEVLDGTPVPLIELIPQVHQRVYRMGLAHLGIVVGEHVDEFAREHRAVPTGQQFQSAENEPYYVLFEDFTHVKFHRRSLYETPQCPGWRAPAAARGPPRAHRTCRQEAQHPRSVGGPCWIRTSDQAIMSRLLSPLS